MQEFANSTKQERIDMARKQTLVFLTLAALASPVFAVDGGAVLGGAIGGGAGAAVGSAVGGKEGAIIGGAIGGGVGAAIGSGDSKETKVVEKEVVYVKDRHDNGLHRGHHKNKHDH